MKTSFQLARGAWSHLFPSIVLIIPAVIAWDKGMVWSGVLLSLAAFTYLAFMVYFFRDPERHPPDDPAAVFAGADGWIRSVEFLDEGRYLNTKAVRISTYLTPFDVHVNRSPIGGKISGLAYTPGKRLLTRSNAASEYNEHSSIFIEGAGLSCLVKQIVGPIVRRVVYWLNQDQAIEAGDRIGIMKFGSRLDVYLPASAVDVVVKKGDRVYAGLTVIAKKKDGQSDA